MRRAQTQSRLSQERAWLGLLLAARLAVGLAYSATVPIWESDNEDGHFAYVRYLAKYRTLLKAGDPEAEKIWEKFQPPLYYVVVAPAIAWLDLGDAFAEPVFNPYYVSGQAGVNIFLHPDHLEGAAYRTALAVFIVRGVSIFISTASVIFVYGAARLIWPASTSAARAATALFAFWPQFLFTGSMVTNDVLVVGLSALAYYLSIRLAAEGFRLRLAGLLAVVLGADLLAKVNAVALIPVAVIALGLSLTAQPRHKSPRPAYQIWLALAGLSLLVVVSLQFIGSLQFVTNQVFQSETVKRLIANTPAPETISTTIPGTTRYVFRTFLASFGWGNFEVYRWLYQVWEVSALLAVLGLAVAALRRLRGAASPLFVVKHWRASSAPGGEVTQPLSSVALLLLAALQLVCSAGLMVALGIALRNKFVPGRYLLPALPAASCLMVSGWQALVPTRWRAHFHKALGAGIVLVGWSIPLWSIAPAYAKPQPLPSEAMIDYPLAARFGNEIELIGYLRPSLVHPGQEFKITLCWQALAPITHNYTVALEIVGPDGQGYGRLNTYPGRGNYPTSFWRVNQRFCDKYSVEARPDLPAPAAASLHVWFFDAATGIALPVTPSVGEQEVAEFAVLPLKVQATSPAPGLTRAARAVHYRFGDGITLTGYEAQTAPDNRGARVSLLWQASADITENYIVFVHLRDTPRTAYAQGDGEPRGSWYPTSLWRRGETILDEHSLTFPEGQTPPALDLYVGLVRADTLVRVPAFDAQGYRIVNDEVVLERGLIFPPPLAPYP